MATTETKQIIKNFHITYTELNGEREYSQEVELEAYDLLDAAKKFHASFFGSEDYVSPVIELRYDVLLKFDGENYFEIEFGQFIISDICIREMLFEIEKTLVVDARRMLNSNGYRLSDLEIYLKEHAVGGAMNGYYVYILCVDHDPDQRAEIERVGCSEEFLEIYDAAIELDAKIIVLNH